MKLTTPKTLALTANALFWTSVFGFAALRPDYSHFTKAVSELGAWGAPNMWGFNVLGYMLPGLLLAFCGWRIARGVKPHALVLPALLIFSALGVSLAGAFPADMADRGSTTTLLHLTGSLSSLLLWLPALIWLAVAARATHAALMWTCLAALALSIGAFTLYSFLYPGLVQRIMFALYFGWFALAAWLSERAPLTKAAG